MSRALPLYLAEQIHFSSNASVQTLVPFITSNQPGFAVSGGAWKDDAAANFARQTPAKSDYVVTTHIKSAGDSLTAELKLIRTIDAKCLGELASNWPAAKPEAGIPDLANRLCILLKEQAELTLRHKPLAYEAPSGPALANYLLRLEQLLAVRCTGIDGIKQDFLNGEREIISGNIQQCLDAPKNIPVRLLLAQTLTSMKRARPELLAEYKEKVGLLQKEKPLPEPAQSVVQRIIDEAMGGNEGSIAS